ncbi:MULTISPECIES: MAPEG family protein [unclassified Halomonas]|uniref:MAPEG family protein n=1 Tax=unclassified Halomonas TaxID=2609666 RepID=UPI0020769FDE|nr:MULTISPECIES: MAPEG family protein [unclassified Halomonas]
MSISLMCIALLSALVIGLGFNVSMARAKSKAMYGYKEDPEDHLYKSVRAHSNAIEYVPIIALLIYVLGQGAPSDWVLWCMVFVTACRYLAAIGIVAPKTMAKPNPLRFIGALGTYIGGFALSVALLINAILA